MLPGRIIVVQSLKNNIIYVVCTLTSISKTFNVPAVLGSTFNVLVLSSHAYGALERILILKDTLDVYVFVCTLNALFSSVLSVNALFSSVLSVNLC